ncbi:MAG: hypothetical protein Q8O89_05285 [Nanoarchaeota archaeon]|nr:hypothetical protein [Nanoarchaeota archaeon]
MVYEKLTAANFRVKYKDFFHLKKLYIMVHEWLVEFGWYSQVGFKARDYSNWPEWFYLQRESQKRGTELWAWWRLEKTIEGVSYWRWKMDINWHGILIKDTQVMHKGVKFDTNWGVIEVAVKAEVVADPDGEWAKHWLLKNVNDLFRGVIFKNEMQRHKLELYREAYRLQEAIKSYLALKTYLPEPEAEAHFYPTFGIGESEGIR